MGSGGMRVAARAVRWLSSSNTASWFVRSVASGDRLEMYAIPSQVYRASPVRFRICSSSYFSRRSRYASFASISAVVVSGVTLARRYVIHTFRRCGYSGSCGSCCGKVGSSQSNPGALCGISRRSRLMDCVSYHESLPKKFCRSNEYAKWVYRIRHPVTMRMNPIVVGSAAANQKFKTCCPRLGVGWAGIKAGGVMLMAVGSSSRKRTPSVPSGNRQSAPGVDRSAGASRASS